MSAVIDALKEAISSIPFTSEGHEVAGDLIVYTNELIAKQA